MKSEIPKAANKTISGFIVVNYKIDAVNLEYAYMTPRWVNIIDMSTKKVLMNERVEGEITIGFGVRNYYASRIKKHDESHPKRYIQGAENENMIVKIKVVSTSMMFFLM
ncbi:MAG: hypothetical protein C5B59_02160 [Bacteroidetes bacterium]|nr:MAG: hypothetical protein C5B59_02160 [Bacteroidota bacterium]